MLSSWHVLSEVVVAAWLSNSSSARTPLRPHFRSVELVGFSSSHCPSLVHSSHLVHCSRRCCPTAWKEPAGHVLHSRAVVFESAVMTSPASQRVCGLHWKPLVMPLQPPPRH